MTSIPTGETPSYPRQEAATRRFRLGAPRAFTISPDGRRLVFVRSAGGRDPVGSLWVADAADGTLAERLVVDARTLVRADGDLPAAEKARRERMRETTAGITAYSTDALVTRAAFSVDGVPYAVDLVDPAATPGELRHPGPVVDPQMSPDGRWVTFVVNGSLHLVDTRSEEPAAVLCRPESDGQAWGLADFIAAEELDRSRGLWWLPSSEALIVELVDESPVAIRWIADPARPETEPTPHRYPAAGTANPAVRLFVVAVDGTRAEIDWDHEAFPYLATVEASHDDGAVISLLSRDQQRQLILWLPAGGAKTTVLRERRLAPWLTLHAGVPCLGPDGALLEIVVNQTDDCYQLVSDDRPVSPAGMDVTGLVHAGRDGAVVLGTRDPLEQHVLRIAWDGAVADLTEGPSVNTATASDGGLLVASADGEATGTRYQARLTWGAGPIGSLVETPVVTPAVAFHRVGTRSLPAAVLWPTGHRAGTRLPVVMAPYGGPHHNRVVRSASAFAADQWLADQGFAVVVVDGRGTPGRGPAWEFAVHGDLASGVLQDQVDGLRALAGTYPDMDLTRVGITGWSFGGFLAALAVLDRPDVFHAAVAGAPVTDWRLYDTAYTERYLGLPREQAAAYDASSLLPRAKRLERPLLLIHGLADDNVLAANTLQLSSALLAAGRAHSVLPLSGVTHMTPQEVVAENLLRLEVGFLTTHLGADLD